MIEVEKKFILTQEESERLIQDTRFIGERVFTDVYYDTKNFLLTSHDKWLRCREGRWELKLPLHEGVNRLADQYEELEEEQQIKQALQFSFTGNFADGLAEIGYFPFCVCKTKRRKYQKESFTIDLDIVDFQDFAYDIGEIELMVDNESEIEGAVEKIMAFAKKQDLISAPVRGKVVEYLKRIKPAHYQALVQAGVVKDF